jgi:putative endonuclease
MNKQFYVYILASSRNGTLYTGYTNDISKRIFQHKTSEVDGFTKKYKVNKLVYFEVFDEPMVAIQREKNIKKWKREWKINLIEKHNPEWEDLLPY